MTAICTRGLVRDFKVDKSMLIVAEVVTYRAEGRKGKSHPDEYPS